MRGQPDQPEAPGAERAEPSGMERIPEPQLQAWSQGHLWQAAEVFGARRLPDGRLRFACWAPRASRVAVVGDFNGWDPARHPLSRRDPHGVWETWIEAPPAPGLYKFCIDSPAGRVLKSDPFGQAFELRPQTATCLPQPDRHRWRDGAWMRGRVRRPWHRRAISVYELHLGSWQRRPDGGFNGYRDLAEPLADYVSGLGFTHVELLPVTEHPYDGSWGYQPIGLFAPTSRFGSPDDFRFLVDTLHQRGIGVILDWVPAHFPRDEHGLARFDGAPLFEYADPQRGDHPEWGTLVYDLGRPQVRNFLIASALHWIGAFHLDGLRVDAVASLLYLDYAREPGQWRPNEHGGRENPDAVQFLRELNTVIGRQWPGVQVIAEESTTWPGVTAQVHEGGLGFALKWNMGWMHDTLDYFRHDPVHRKGAHRHLTFGITYLPTERFMLPLSHDEVVHGKSPLIYKMPGDPWQQFANLRLLYAWMWTYPGKKLLFMGGEFAQTREWSHERELDWPLLQYPEHRGVQRLVADLNALYRDHAALHGDEAGHAGFEWIDCDDAATSVLSFQRRGGRRFLLVVFNFTPVVRGGYRLGVPRAGRYTEVLNTDSAHYGGSNVGNAGSVRSEPVPWMGQPHSVVLNLPPLGGLVLQWTR